ncbi:hypothetical protein ACSW9M_18130 (plasmid) [Clostridium perfringens]
MGIWDRISKEQYEKVVGECNQLKFRIQELERYNANLEERLKETPVREGQLNCKAIMNGKNAIRGLQNDFHKHVEGLL